MRFSTFHTVGRRRTLARPVSATRPIHEAAAGLSASSASARAGSASSGVSVSNLTHNAFQLTLDEGWREVALSEAVDKVRAKYGSRSLKLAGGALTDRRLAHPSPGLAFQPPDV